MYLQIHVYTYIYSACTCTHILCAYTHVHTLTKCTCTLVYTGHSSHAIKVITKADFIARRRQQQLLVWIYTWNHFVSTNESCTASPSPSSLGSLQEKLTMQGRNINPYMLVYIHHFLLTNSYMDTVYM